MELKAMEEHKSRYLSAFLERIGMEWGDYVKGLEELEERLRGSYVEVDGFDREHFILIMAVDGAFLMEFLLRYCYGHWQMNNDRIFGRQRLLGDVKEDLFVIENQLPFFYLEHLFRLYEKSETNVSFTLKEMVEYFISEGLQMWECPTDDKINIKDGEVHHLLHFLIICLQQIEIKERKPCTNLSTPTVSELHRAGVKFRPSSTRCLSSINFSSGILEIPRLKLYDMTEMIFRNMQAFEYCHQLENYVGDYISLMDQLINDGEDMKILVQSGIIDNWLEDNHVAAAVFNNLGKGTLVSLSNFCYTQVIEDLNVYYKARRHRWKATLKQKYFNNPWTIISFVAAFVLLLLTIIQTVCSILQAV